MKIIDKLTAIRTEMANDPQGNAALGDKMQKYSCLAIHQGSKNWAWHEYMRMFASNDDQLKRLLGDDDDFNATVWGQKTLAYIVAAGVCGINTVGTVGGGAGLTTTMRNGLDAPDLDSTDDPNFA